MKKLLIIILAVFLLAGCSVQPAEQESPPAPEVTISDTPSQSPETIAPDTTENSTEPSADFPPVSESPDQASDTAQPPSETPPESPEPEQTPPSESPVLDKYQTEPVPEGKPQPIEPQDVTTGDTAYTCTLSVRCDTILDNIGDLDPEKLELVPEDGVIFAAQTVTFYEGESVFDVLQREMKRAKIHMEFRNTPIYNSAYIMGINNLYEFDCGALSGWMYRVNDWFPNYGCSRYQLEDGDIVEWIYTCDLGRDIGGEGAVS